MNGLITNVPLLNFFPVELLDKVPCLKSHAGTLLANSLRHRLRGYTSTCILWAPCSIYLFFCDFIVYFTFFLSLENETSTDFQTQPSQSVCWLSSNVWTNQHAVYVTVPNIGACSCPQPTEGPLLFQPIVGCYIGRLWGVILANHGVQKCPPPTEATYYIGISCCSLDLLYRLGSTHSHRSKNLLYQIPPQKHVMSHNPHMPLLMHFQAELHVWNLFRFSPVFFQ